MRRRAWRAARFLGSSILDTRLVSRNALFGAIRDRSRFRIGGASDAHRLVLRSVCSARSRMLTFISVPSTAWSGSVSVRYPGPPGCVPGGMGWRSSAW